MVRKGGAGKSCFHGKENHEAIRKSQTGSGKAKKKRDASKKRLEADEFTVKECEAALMESENNEYVNEIRAWGLTVEELKEIRAAMQKKSLTEVLHEKEEKDRNDEHYKVEN